MTIGEKQTSLHLELKDLQQHKKYTLMTAVDTWWQGIQKNATVGTVQKFLEQPVQVVRCGLCAMYIPLNNECSLEITLLRLLVPSIHRPCRKCHIHGTC